MFKRKGDKVSVRLDPDEAAAFLRWLEDLDALIEDPGVLGSDVARRLSPVVYPDDPLAEDDYQQFNGIFMAEERRTAAGEMRRTLEEGRRADGSVRCELDDDAVEQWLMSVNHLRLAVGTVVGIEQDVDPDIDRDDPRFPLFAVYVQLSYVLEELLGAG